MVRYEVFLRMNYCLNLLGLVLCPDHLDILLQPEFEFKIMLYRC